MNESVEAHAIVVSQDDDICPHCGILLAEEDGMTRRIGVEFPKYHDGVIAWQCPDCGGRWHRFEKSDTPFVEILRELAQRYIDTGKITKRLLSEAATEEGEDS